MDKKGIAKATFFLASLVVLTFFVYSYVITPISSGSSATIWTTDAYGNPKTDFSPDSTVYIHGSDFLRHRKVYVYITRPDGIVEKGSIFSNYQGGFVYEYRLNGINGLYNVLATDRTNTAQTTFTDASIHFTQCANDDNNDDVKDDCEWVTGSLNQNNAIYSEGNVVPHRLFHQIDDAGAHTIRIRYQFSKGDKYAYDFISTPDLTQSGADFNPCGDLPVWISSSVCTSLYSGATSASVPSDTFDDVASRETPVSRTILIGGASSPSVTIVGHDPSTNCFQNCGDSDSFIDVTFTTSSPDTLVVLWFGGHLAQASDPDGGGPVEGWGTGFGASSISGAPFHISYFSLDGESVGKRDNQIQPGAVLPPPECFVDEDCNDGNPCIRDQCINNSCVYTPEPLSTLCELDDDLCTHDHCDGSGVCVWNYDEPVPDPEECKSFYCDPSDGQIKEDYSSYPWSTFCELDDDLCTIDHCDGSGSCVWKEDVYVPDPEECLSYYCDPSDGIVYPDYYDYSTYCDNGLYCDGPEHCDGAGSCVNLGPPIDCTYLDNECQIGVCNEVTDQCGPDYYDYSTQCDNDLYCDGPDHCDGFGSCVNLGPEIDCSYLDSECQEGVCNEDIDDCVPDYYQLSTFCELDDDLCTIDHCDGSGSCVWKEDVYVPDPEECLSYYCDPSDGQIKEDYTDYPWSTECQADQDLCTIDHCDGAGSCVNYDDVDCSYLDNQCQEGICDSEDGECYPDFYDFSTYCDNSLYCDGPDHCDGFGSCVNLGPPIDCSYLDDQCQEGLCDEDIDECIADYSNYPFCTTCEADDDPCTIDHCDGEGICVTYDEVPPPSGPNKTVGDPKIECEEEDWCDYKITMDTPITLDCGNNTVWWRYALDGEWFEWHNDTSPIIIYFPEESNHTLEVYCKNDCGVSETDIEYFKVEGTRFEIPLYTKWNLISVPFALLDDNIEEVFEDIEDVVESVWTYDDSEWYFWMPEGPGNLEMILPGWGYWVLTTEDVLLTIGGSLFGPITTPPYKDLVAGWNLIGYYGTDWQKYSDELEAFDECGDNRKDSDYAYCALNSLLDTQEGFPRWSSLMSFVNCGDHDAYWLGLNVCDDMFAGKGYWIEMDMDDIFAPPTNCIWDGVNCEI